MNHLRTNLKSEARQLLRDRWSGAIASVLFCALAVCLVILFELLGNLLFGVTTPYTLFSAPQISYADWAFLTHPSFWVISGAILLSLLLVLPLSVGRATWYCGVACGDGEGPQALAAPFRSLRAYGRTLYVGLQLVLRQLVLGLLFLLVPYGVGLLGTVGRFEWNWPEPVGSILTLLSLLLGLCAAFLYLVVLQRYMLVPYLILRSPELSAREVFRRSRQATRGMRLELAVASLSFWYWLLACLAFFPLLYVMPYYAMTRALYARTLLAAGSAP